MNRNFKIRLVDFCKEGKVNIRFFSERKCDLRIKDVKFYYSSRDFIKSSASYMSINLNNSSKTVTFQVDNDTEIYFTSITMIVKDMTNKKQFAVQISTDGKILRYTDMVFENV